MKLTILGCGASFGVPVMACDCQVCNSTNIRNNRTRTSAWLQSESSSVLIDAGPDLRIQGLRERIQTIDGIVQTHFHEDHTGGINDLRPFSMMQNKILPLYGQRETLDNIRREYAFIFDEAPTESSRPQLTLHEIDRDPIQIGNIQLTPIPVWHGSLDIRGFRVDNIAYLTDVSGIPEESFSHLENLDLLILSALRHTPHPLHFTIAEALHAIERIKPKQTRLIHLSHDLEYERMNIELPNTVELAYDGLVFEW